MNARIVNMWNSPKRSSIIIGLISFNAGIGLGYFIALRKNKEIHMFENAVKLDFTTDELKELAVTSTNITINEERVSEDIIIPISEEEVTEFITQEISPDSDWDYEKELSNRTLTTPYIIHNDEFYADEKDYAQSTLTYYAGDNIMCDENNSPVYNFETITGPLLFGHGSKDMNVVHIRNDIRHAEYEILLDPGLYSVEILGLEIENNSRVNDLKHSKHRKFREE